MKIFYEQKQDQTKQKNRCNLFIDGEFFSGLSQLSGLLGLFGPLDMGHDKKEDKICTKKWTKIAISNKFLVKLW